MKTLDRCILLWCAISTGFGMACATGWIGSRIAIDAGKGDDLAATVVVCIVSASVWLCTAVAVTALMKRIYGE